MFLQFSVELTFLAKNYLVISFHQMLHSVVWKFTIVFQEVTHEPKKEHYLVESRVSPNITEASKASSWCTRSLSIALMEDFKHLPNCKHVNYSSSGNQMIKYLRALFNLALKNNSTMNKTIFRKKLLKNPKNWIAHWEILYGSSIWQWTIFSQSKY